MSFPRSSGILLHPTSLPGPFGIGDLGGEARRFVDFLASSGQSLWQILPLGPPVIGGSPYLSASGFAGNPLLVCPATLVEDGLLEERDLQGTPRSSIDRVDFRAVIDYKRALLSKAFERFKRSSDSRARSEFDGFCRRAASWLDDYALFRALHDAGGGVAWNDWEPEVARREPGALRAAQVSLRHEVEANRFFQFLFFKQWFALRAYCRERGVKVIGDMPIFVAYDSADVWTHRDLFKLDESGRPAVVAGVPPDLYSKTGQLWGNPLYDWDAIRASGYRWWIERMRHTLDLVDIVRIDHFRGFSACWEVPSEDQTAERGRWVEVPGRELFSTLARALHALPVIAEDLGTITPEVESLRDELGFPGMRVLQFAFGGDRHDPHLPHNYVRRCVVYTGTHDNDTVVGWFRGRAGEGTTRSVEHVDRERREALEYLNSDGSQIYWDFIRAALASVADVAIVPLQDVLGLDGRARMNLPASPEGNWGWRFEAGALTSAHAARLRRMTEIYGRLPSKTEVRS